jgi:hypothetical protein
MHTHANGDAAIDLAIDCLQDALREQPSPDHRFVLQHCQLADRAQLGRMKALGLCANFFANHHFRVWILPSIDDICWLKPLFVHPSHVQHQHLFQFFVGQPSLRMCRKPIGNKSSRFINVVHRPRRDAI